MKLSDACIFLLVGLGMIAGPSLWPEHFAAAQRISATWLLFMGGLQALGGGCVLAVEGAREAVRWSRRIAALDPLDFTVALADVRRVISPSLYTLLENPEEEEVALRLQQQLLRHARG